MDSGKGRECRCANIETPDAKADVNLVSPFAQSRPNPDGIDKEKPIIYLAFEQLVTGAKTQSNELEASAVALK